MVNDRGSIKWTSLMLPEHVEMLKTLWNEDKKKQKPLLDDQQLQEINHVVNQAYSQQKIVTLTVYRSGLYKEVTGTIIKLYINEQFLRIKLLDELDTIKLQDIVHAVEVD